MTLSPGHKIGPYRITGLLGKGGMGEVYRAEDTRLGRTVAIKIIPPQPGAREEPRRRFEIEARAIASLNHAHICALFDIGEQDGDYMVMEYLEGESLAGRLQKGPLPLDEALRHAIQILGALDQAHRRGVYHRDIKPGNIMLTKSGVKLLDFGLARLRPTQEVRSEDALTLSVTSEGTVLGTPQYMAPEQAEGRDVDGRGDIFSLASVLYESITGRKAFPGITMGEILRAVLLCEPPSPIEGVPSALNRALRTCWARDPDDRWQSAADLRRELQWIAEGGGDISPVVAQQRGMSRREMLAWGTAIAGSAAAAIVGRRFGTAPPAPIRTRFTIEDRPPSFSVNRFQSLPAISPDGKMVAMIARGSGALVIWVRSMDSTELHELPGTETAGSLFWSPNSQWLGFFANDQLKKISPAGGPPTRICETPIGSGASWNNRDVIVFQKDRDGALFQVPATGGLPTPATVLTGGQLGHMHPTFLPDGKTFLFSVLRGPQEGQGIFSAVLGSTEARKVSPIPSNVRYASSGHLLFHEGDNLIARRFDADQLLLEGESIPIGSKLYTYEGAGSFDISTTGTLVYAELETVVSQLTWFDRNGRAQGMVGPPGPFIHLDLSRDEKRVLVERLDGPAGEVWLIDTARGIPTPIIATPGNWAWDPFWSPDGSEFVYAISADRPIAIYRQSPGAKGLGEKLRVSPMVPAPPSHWSADGKYVVFNQVNQDGTRDINVLDVSKRAEVKTLPYLSASHALGQGRLSPDNRWMAYVSGETGSTEVFVSPFPNATAKWRISRDGGHQPRWRADGKELFFLAPDKTLMAAPIPTTPDQAGAPAALFRSNAVGTMQFARSDYAPSEDGRRFLLNDRVGETPPQILHVIVGWWP